ncbi:peroxisomal ATPase PEX1-like [Cloeon dipterum]|uniref:peroxisomal ATPase PEX1-like n=1 Tax=Cloeon dipterum TaxID=197152 RepID=UPI00321FFFA0
MDNRKGRLMAVKFVNAKDSFLHVNSINVSSMQGKVYEIRDETRGNCLAVCSCYATPLKNLKDNEVGMSQKLAKAIGLGGSESLFLTEIDNLIPKSSQVIFTISDPDYAILVMNATKVEYIMLDQIRLVKRGQNVVVWISPMVSITLNTEKILPESELALLTNETELHILPSSDVRSVSGLGSWEDPNPEEIQTGLVCRVIFSEKPHVTPFVAKIHPSVKPSFLFALGKILSVDKTMHLQLIFDSEVSPAVDFLSNLPIIYLDKRARDQANSFFDGCKIFLEPLEIVRNTEFIVHVSKNYPVQSVKDDLKSLAEKLNRELLVVKQTVFPLKNDLAVKFEMKSSHTNLSSTSIESCNMGVKLGKFELKNEPAVVEAEHPDHQIFRSWLPLLNNLKKSLVTNARTHVKSPIAVLKGTRGSGVETFLQQFVQLVVAPPLKLHDLALDCKAFKGKTVDTLKNKLMELFLEGTKHDPCIIIFENIDQFFPLQTHDVHESPESSYRLGVLQCIWNLSYSFSKRHNCYVVTTAVTDQEVKIWDDMSIPVELFPIPDLSLEDKVQALKQCLTKLNCNWTNELEDNSAQIIEICNYQDICDIAGRATFEKLKSMILSDEPVVITSDDLSSARNFLTSQSLKDFNLLRIGDQNGAASSSGRWPNVGGLSDVKEKLTEMIFWPFMYSHLFATNPLKLQKGALLYGMPGTGKTLLAVELAKSSGMNLIHIKGPELLNKFIGASEEAVRNLFEKASAAKPCILFFDEIDSLAPRRGRDTTGVSDRVVNQLLTSLDGVDSPAEAGVWVLAASSRPDLIDRALLRPGRFDTMLHCNLPTRLERSEILQILSSGLKISSDTDLNKLAEMTDGFCGADIQALLQTAQLVALEEFVDVFSEETSDKSMEHQEQLEVNWNHIQLALQKTRPSLSQEERRRYEKIFKEYELSLQPVGRGKRAVLKQRTLLA